MAMKTVRALEFLVLLFLAACGGARSPAEAGEAGARQVEQQVDDAEELLNDSASPAGLQAPGNTRHIRFNGRELQGNELQTIAMLEMRYGPIPDGAYWYDAATGAAGMWGGPVAAVLPAGLSLGGRLPADASGGGQGFLTGTFVNGRELHPYDVVRLRQLFGVVYPGRYWWDAMGNTGIEGGPMIGNFRQLVRQRGGSGAGGGDPFYRNYGNGESAFVSQGCTSVSGRTSPSDSDSSYSYYIGCD